MNLFYSIYGRKTEYSIHKTHDLCYRCPLIPYHRFLLKHYPHMYRNCKRIKDYLNFSVPEHIDRYLHNLVLGGLYIPCNKIEERVFVDGCHPNPYGISHLGNIVAMQYGFIYHLLLELKYSRVDYAYYVNDIGNREISNVDRWIFDFLNHPNLSIKAPDLLVYQSRISLKGNLKLESFDRDDRGVYIGRLNPNSKFNKRYLYINDKLTYLGSDILLYYHLDSMKYDSYYLIAGQDHYDYLIEIEKTKLPNIDIRIRGRYVPLVENVRGRYSKRKNIAPINIGNWNLFYRDRLAFHLSLISMHYNGIVDTDLISKMRSYERIEYVNSIKSLFNFFSALEKSVEIEDLSPLTHFFNNPLMRIDYRIRFLLQKYLC